MARDRGLSFVEKKQVLSKELIKDIMGTLFYSVAAILLGVVLVFAYGMKVSMIGPSMSPTIVDSQITLVDRFSTILLAPNRNDVVCFYPKGNTSSHLYIKRVVGLPGEVIQIKDGYVYVNGVRLLEDGEFDRINDPGLAENEFKLGADEYFVLGDNRNNSEDSRYGNIGAVSRDTIMGKVWFRLRTKDNKQGFIR